jgi:CDP-glucose 4,6-dehydratase
MAEPPLMAMACFAENGQGVAIFSPTATQPWNFGPPQELVLPVRDLVTRASETWGDGAAWRSTAIANAPHEATLLQLDSAKARTRLGWEPKLSIAETVTSIVEWHKQVARGGDARAITEQQIVRFMEGA